MNNNATNFSVEEAELRSSGEVILFATVCLSLGVLICATIIGNVFVMVAIVKDRNLNNLSNYLVFSLALADLFVALLVMPIGAVYEIQSEWRMGAVLCDLWTLCDVLCCTASILHLLAIALDRYWAVTNVDYARNRCKKRIYSIIGLVWAVSFAVSIAPNCGWKDPDFSIRIEVEKRCLVSQDLGYQVFATCSSFYVPLVAILVLYSRIFIEARRRIRKRPGAASKAMLLVQRPPPALTATSSSSLPTTSADGFDPPSSVVDTTLSCSGQDSPKPQNGTHSAVGRFLHIGQRSQDSKKRKADNNQSKREKKAAKTLAIITGVFIVCWMPFFVMALILPLCNDCESYYWLFNIFLWLGYANSTLNPIIYTIFSPDFRSAFKKLLCITDMTHRPH